MSGISEKDGFIEVFPPALVSAADETKISVKLNYLNKSEELWFKFPSRYQEYISSLSDPFVIAVLFLAMEHGLDVKVHGAVTPSLIENAEMFQQIWNKWDPARYKKIRIIPSSVSEPVSRRAEHTAMMFSGGLDSCYTAWKHVLSGNSFPQKRPQSALFVLGFDIPVEEAHYFNSYYLKAKKITDSIQVDLIPVQFNFRKIIGNWEMSHGTALASCLHLFSGLFSTGLIASSHAYDSLRFPWGSNSLTDPLLSNNQLRIINDGGECSRWEKAEAVSQWDVAMQHLRVCHKGEQKDRNCGVCSTCLSTALGFAAAGKKCPASLNVGTIDDAIKKIYTLPVKPIGIVRLEEMMAFARERGHAARWLTNLEACCQFHKKRLKLTKPLGKMMLFRNKLRQTFDPARRKNPRPPLNRATHKEAAL